MEFRLLEKTELWVGPLRLEGADLGLCAQSVAAVLGLKTDEVMVTDALEDHLTFDVLVPTLDSKQFLSRQGELLDALAGVPGVLLDQGTEVHSEGILGLINLDPDRAGEMLERSQAMGQQIQERIRLRACILPTGPEVARGEIQDTNTPFLSQALTELGFSVQAVPALADDTDAICRAMLQAADSAFGLVITTGGVGAEGKDRTIEALLKADAGAATPYVLKFQRGHGRHQKDGVRLGVGRLDQSLIVCLPGPNDEVRLLWPVLAQALEQRWDTAKVASGLAQALRQKFLDKSSAHSQQHAAKLWQDAHGA